MNDVADGSLGFLPKGADAPRKPKKASRHAGEKGIQIFLPTRVHEALKDAAWESKKSIQDYMTALIVAHLRVTKKKVLTEFEQPHLEGDPNV